MKTSLSHSEAVSGYKKPALFFILSTLIPWAFWFAAGFVSRITPYEQKYLDVAGMLAFVGLPNPVVVAFFRNRAEDRLRVEGRDEGREAARRRPERKQIGIEPLVSGRRSDGLI